MERTVNTEEVVEVVEATPVLDAAIHIVRERLRPSLFSNFIFSKEELSLILRALLEVQAADEPAPDIIGRDEMVDRLLTFIIDMSQRNHVLTDVLSTYFRLYSGTADPAWEAMGRGALVEATTGRAEVTRTADRLAAILESMNGDVMSPEAANDCHQAAQVLRDLQRQVDGFAYQKDLIVAELAATLWFMMSWIESLPKRRRRDAAQNTLRPLVMLAQSLRSGETLVADTCDLCGEEIKPGQRFVALEGGGTASAQCWSSDQDFIADCSVMPHPSDVHIHIDEAEALARRLGVMP